MLRYGERCGFSPSWAEPTLIYAAESGNVLALSPFTYEFDINHRIGGDQTALMVSASNGRFDAVKMLIDDGADSAIRDRGNNTAADLASSAGHSVVASLLLHHRSTDWKLIKTTESMIEELRRDSTYSELSEYESLLESKKFATLNAARLDCTIGKELVWFRATESCSIGLNDSGSLIWMFDQMRASHEW